MIPRDEEILIYLLEKLMRAQDAVTHMNEKGKEYQVITRHLIEKRENIYEDILSFVRGLVKEDK